MADKNTVILRVSLDEGKTEEQLKQLVLDIEKTRQAQKALTAERKAGALTDEAFALQTVALRTQLKAQTQEQTAVTKNLELYRRAVDGVAGSYDAAQAQLSLAQRQYQQLEQSAENGTEATQALAGVIDGLRNTLKATDAQQSLFVRNVGNYPDGKELTALIQQLVKLEEETKRGTQTTEEANRAQMQIAGFRTQAMQAAAKEGKTYEETTSLIQGYSAAIRPAVTALVQLEEEQTKVAEGSEAFNQIGFKIKQASQQIQQVPTEVKGVSDSLTELDDTTGIFGGRVAGLKAQFAQAKQGIELARGGFVGLKGAIAATGIGLLILTLASLYEYFTKTDEGAEDLAAGMAYLKGIVSVLESVLIGAGKALVLVFKDPKQAASDFIDFLEGQVVNRVKSFGVIWDAIRNGDAKGLANGILQFNTGVEDSIGKVQRLGVEMKSAADAAYSIARAKDELEDLERDEIVRTEKNRNEIERLVLTAKDRTKTEAERLANLDKAGKLETQTLEATINLARQRLSIIERENFEAERTGKISDEQRTAAEQAQAEVVKLAGQSLNLQQSIQNRRSVLLQAEAADAKTAADKATALAEKAAERRLQIRREALALEAQLLERQLRTVQVNSDEELNLLQRKLKNGYQAELAVKNLTVSQKRLIDAKYENESLALTLDFNRRRLQAALQAALDTTAAQLSAQQQGGAEALRLQVQQIENQRRLAIAALNENADNTAKINAINATAEQQRRQVEYNEATRLLGEHLADKRRAVELDYAAGLIQEAEYQRRLAALNKAGTDAQTVINSDYRQSNAENQRKSGENELEVIRTTTAATKRGEEVKQEIKEATLQSAQQYTDAIITLFGEESEAGKAALALKKVLALAEIGISLQKQLAANAEAGAKISALAPPVSTPLGIAYTFAANALAITAAAAAAASILKFRKGGIAQGASHEQGGIQLYHQGRHAGIEIEGGEPILTAGVSRSPILLTMASHINQLAGGRPLVPSAYMAMGGVASAAVRDSLRGETAEPFDYDRLAAAMSKVKVKATIIDVKAGLERDNFTQSRANT